MVFRSSFPRCHWSKSQRTNTNESGACTDRLFRHLHQSKIRRIYIPKALRKEAIEWLDNVNRTTGYLFLNRFGERITTRGIAQQLKNYATKYGLNEKVVYPHSFRHRFAKNFLEKFNDISLLADLMGHESIETTRIYLRRSSAEQQEIVDKVITW